MYSADQRSRPFLQLIPAFPLQLVSSQIDPATHVFSPTESQAESFAYLTNGLSPDLPLSTSLDCTLLVPCAYCGRPNTARWLTLPEPNEVSLVLAKTGQKLVLPAVGRGWAQTGFEVECETCGERYGRNELKVRKLADDLGRCLDGQDGGYMR